MNISLKDFIKEVKEDLKSAIDEKEPFFVMEEVELEVSFVLNTEGSASAKLVVVDIGGQTKASQMHKVKIKLSPFLEESKESYSLPLGIDIKNSDRNSDRKSRKNSDRKARRNNKMKDRIGPVFTKGKRGDVCTNPRINNLLDKVTIPIK